VSEAPDNETVATLALAATRSRCEPAPAACTRIGGLVAACSSPTRRDIWRSSSRRFGARRRCGFRRRALATSGWRAYGPRHGTEGRFRGGPVDSANPEGRGPVGPDSHPGGVPARRRRAFLTGREVIDTGQPSWQLVRGPLERPQGIPRAHLGREGAPGVPRRGQGCYAGPRSPAQLPTTTRPGCFSRKPHRTPDVNRFRTTRPFGC
jgi:hypothetical protein